MAKRNAVVVTHTRLRQTGTVVAEAVSQLRVAGFEVTIIDNTEAPDFGVQPPCVSDDTEIVVQVFEKCCFVARRRQRSTESIIVRLRHTMAYSRAITVRVPCAARWHAV